MYRENLNPPISLIAFITFMYFSLALAVWAAFDFLQAAVTMAVLVASLPFIWRALRMQIKIDSQLHIDRAHIELKYLKNPVAVDETQYKLLRSTQSDARAFHATRPWLKRGVQVFVNDSRDKTTYWLIGTKNEKELSAFLANS